MGKGRGSFPLSEQNPTAKSNLIHGGPDIIPFCFCCLNHKNHPLNSFYAAWFCNYCTFERQSKWTSMYWWANKTVSSATLQGQTRLSLGCWTSNWWFFIAPQKHCSCPSFGLSPLTPGEGFIRFSHDSWTVWELLFYISPVSCPTNLLFHCSPLLYHCAYRCSVEGQDPSQAPTGSSAIG